MKIGVVGYSSGSFDTRVAALMVEIGIIQLLYDDLVKNKTNFSKETTIVSGLTNVGIPKLAYEIAAKHDWSTVGIACELAKGFDCYPVDEEIIVGEEWGDESQTFINYIDCLIRVGGGEQSLEEVALFKALKPDGFLFEMELPREG